MKAPTLLFLGLVASLLGAAATSAQTLPLSWNRDRDWVPQRNPGPDGKGNLVWTFLYQKGNGAGIGRWSTLRGGSWSRNGGTNAATINRGLLYHQCYRDYTGSAHVWSPLVRFTNTTGKTFALKIGGKLRVAWPAISGTTTAHNTPVTVEFEFWDSVSGQAKTLLSRFVAKPTSSTRVESMTFAVDLPAVSFAPRSFVTWSIRARDHSWMKKGEVSLMDKDLWLVPSVVATETVRRASPPNPLTLSKGRTSRPRLGATWDPFIANPPPGATSDLLAIGVTALHLKLPFGTLLCDPLMIAASRPGVPFSLAVPNSVTIVGAKLCTQGASVTPASGLQLANALDIVVGDR